MASASELTLASIAGSWSPQPVAVLLAGGALWWYLSRRARLDRIGQPWSALRTSSFVAGLGLLVIICCGPAAHFGRSVYWVWLSQSLTLLLIVPVPLMAGQPIELARLSNPAGRTSGWLDAATGRWFSSPLVGPALMPLVCVAALFGPVPGWAAGSAPVSWLVQLLLLGIGSVIVLPLVVAGDTLSSVAVGAAVAVGFIELLVDAVPGIVLRLSTHPASGFFSHRHSVAGAPAWLHDQQIGGGILWCVAELLDLPFLLLVFRRWVRADAREAAAVDAVLDERELRRPTDQDDDTPWFLTDPRMRDRFR
ncbi:MAG: cytochrome c oxidase assembly protein [Jatrophihabitans sp.]